MDFFEQTTIWCGSGGGGQDIEKGGTYEVSAATSSNRYMIKWDAVVMYYTITVVVLSWKSCDSSRLSSAWTRLSLNKFDNLS